jgi:hypothetical protein
MTQEPIAYINVEKRTLEFAEPIKWHTPTVANIDRIPLFTQRTWVGLTDEEIQECYSEAYKIVQGRQLENAFYKTIEAKLKKKNT